MEDRKDRIVRFAKQNRWFRYCLIGAYTAVYTLPSLWKKYLSLRMEMTACLLVAALCFSQIFAVTVSAEETVETMADQAMASQNGDTGTEDTKTEDSSDESGADNAETSADAKGDSEGSSADGTDAMEKEKIPSSPEEDTDNSADSKDPAADSGGGNDSVITPDHDEANESDPAADSDDVSGNDLTADSDDASGNETEKETDAVSGNDPTADFDDMSGEDPAPDPDDVSGNDPAAAPGDISGNDPEDTQYSYIPQLFIDCRMKESTAGILVGNASSVLVLSTVSSYTDPEAEDGFGMSPAVCAYGYADGKMLYADLQTGPAEVSLPDNFYGSIVFTAEDAVGNTCEVSTPMLLMDASAPDVCITETELTDGGRRVEAVLKDEGAAATGIAQVSCLVNGEDVPVEYEVTGISENCYGQAVISEAAFLLPMEESGRYTVQLDVADHAGNISSCVQDIDILEKRGPISVSAPSRVTLTINPWADGEQVCSDSFIIENRSGYDIIVTLQNVRLTVNREDVGGDPARKDCRLYLSCDMWGDISLPEGDSGELFSVRLPAKKEDGEENGALTLQVRGSLSDGSEMHWKDEDVKLGFSFDYRAASVK